MTVLRYFFEKTEEDGQQQAVGEGMPHERMRM
jgi:hypothetical protein